MIFRADILAQDNMMGASEDGQTALWEPLVSAIVY